VVCQAAPNKTEEKRGPLGLGDLLGAHAQPGYAAFAAMSAPEAALLPAGGAASQGFAACCVQAPLASPSARTRGW
jgi:hypothetical protein